VKGYTLSIDWQSGSVSILRAVDDTSLNSSTSSSSSSSSSNSSNSRHAQPSSLADYCRCLEADLKPLWRVTGDHVTANVSAATTAGATASAAAGWLHRSADTDVYGDAEYCLTNEGVLRGESVAVLHNPVLPIALVATSWH
jgi:hypothetical protein